MTNLDPETLLCTISDDDIIYFLHIRKAGGSTLSNILDAQFPEHHCFPEHISGPNHKIQSVLKKLEQTSENFKFFKGHRPYHVHQYLHRKPTYITMLRHPVDRFVSLYYHVKFRAFGHPWHTTAQEVNLDDFVWLSNIRQGGDWSNGQFKHIFGRKTDSEQITDNQRLQFVKQRLAEEFVFFGLTERFTESLFLLAHTFHWAPIREFVTRNVNENNEYRYRSPISDETLRRIKDLNELDCELYSFAEDLFESRITRLHELRGGEFMNYLADIAGRG